MVFQINRMLIVTMLAAARWLAGVAGRLATHSMAASECQQATLNMIASATDILLSASIIQVGKGYPMSARVYALSSFEVLLEAMSPQDFSDDLVAKVRDKLPATPE